MSECAKVVVVNTANFGRDDYLPAEKSVEPSTRLSTVPRLRHEKPV